MADLMTSADGYKVDPVNGLVYGKRGFPIRRINGGGYVKHYRPEGGKMCHRIIWETYHQMEIPPGMEINHINGIKHDNRIVNLELVTPQENKRHAQETGLARSLRGGEHPHAKLSAEAVLAIRQEAGSHNEIAKKYGISPTNVWAIKHRVIWRHLEPNASPALSP